MKVNVEPRRCSTQVDIKYLDTLLKADIVDHIWFDFEEICLDRLKFQAKLWEDLCKAYGCEPAITYLDELQDLQELIQEVVALGFGEYTDLLNEIHLEILKEEP